MTTEHKEFHGRKVRIPNPAPGRINPHAGKAGEVAWAGWDDWYCVFVDGVYLVRVRASEIAKDLIEEPK